MDKSEISKLVLKNDPRIRDGADRMWGGLGTDRMGMGRGGDRPNGDGAGWRQTGWGWDGVGTNPRILGGDGGAFCPRVTL